MNEIINQIACVFIAITLPPFFKVINKSEVFFNQNYLDRLFANIGLVCIFIGSLNGITDQHVTISSVLIRLGVSMIFIWGYLFHKSKTK